MENKIRNVSPLMSGFIGMLAAINTNILLYPLDLIKVKLQAQAPQQKLVGWWFRSIRNIVTSTYSSNKIRGFYIGILPGIIGPTLAWGSYMMAYKWSKENHNICFIFNIKESSWSYNFICGLQAGVIMTLITNPIFVIKTRMQVSNSKPKLSMIAKQVIITEGFHGMYKGLIPALPLTLHAAFHWSLFEKLKNSIILHKSKKKNLKNIQMNSLETFISASLSKLIASFITYPLHVFKTCLQSKSEYIPLYKIIIDIFRINGIRGYYSGFIPHLIRTVPNSTITMFLIEHLTQIISKFQTKNISIK
jgi:solute carrier family 25 folate transporter 32